MWRRSAPLQTRMVRYLTNQNIFYFFIRSIAQQLSTIDSDYYAFIIIKGVCYIFD